MRPATIAQLVFIALAAVVVFGFVRAAQNDTRRASCSAVCALGPTYANANRLAPEFELPDMNGKPVKLSSFRGKPLVLNFWTKTCEPCLKEMPAIRDLAKIAEKNGEFSVVTVSTDEGPADVKEALEVALDGPPTFPILFDPNLQVVAGRFGTRLFPETWIIDAQGVIRGRFDRALDWSSPLAIEAAESLTKFGSCPVEFDKGEPMGQFAGLCDDG